MIKRMNNNALLSVMLCIIMSACSTTKTANGQSDVPKKALEYFQKGLEHQAVGEYEEAIASLKQAIKKAPNFLDAHDALANTYQRMKDYPKAIGTYKNLLLIEPNHLFANYELGNIYFDMINLDSSEFYFKNFLKLNRTTDKYSIIASETLENVKFARYAMAHPVPLKTKNLGPNINTKEQEYSPAFSLDEQTIYLTRRMGDLGDIRPNEDIYYATRTETGWNRIKLLEGPVNTEENEGAFSITADGNTIFFTACSRNGGVGQCDIWVTSKDNGTWTQPACLDKPLNSVYWESQPSMASNGTQIYFTSDRPGGFGGTDLYVSTFGEKGWETPVNLGKEINTPKDDQFPFIHSDNTTLYFSSAGHPGLGNSDLYVSHLKPDGTWETPKNLGYPINTTGYDWNMVVSRDGKTAYYSSDSKTESQGRLDLYSFELPEEMRAQRVSYVRGTVTDAVTKKPLSCTVLLTPLAGGTPIETYSDARKGQFLVPLKADQQYALTIDKKEYLFHSEYFDMPNVPSDQPFDIAVALQKLEVGKSVVLNNIFFDTDKFVLKPASQSELEKLKAFMVQNTTVNIEISGHTDNVGSAAHNKTLSENRAKSVYNYLVENGIASSRLSFKGYGDTVPLASNENEAGRAKNRRTEFKVVK
jgi:outer membrane protein OmpA-like peptidoglycan-associated protein